MSQKLFRRKALEKLASPEQLDQLMSITTPRGWLTLLGLGVLLLAAGLWSVFGSIPTTVSGDGVLILSGQNADQLEAVVYVSIWDGTRIKPGMEAKVSPVTVLKEEYGLIVGKVTSVERNPASFEDMIRTLGNEMLADLYSSEGKLIKVAIELETAEDTPSGYEWTSKEGPSTTLDAGTICNSVIVLERERPIQLVFSELK
jgi:hypothetical protein